MFERSLYIHASADTAETHLTNDTFEVFVNRIHPHVASLALLGPLLILITPD